MLQLDHLAGERLDVALRGVDDGEPLLELRQALVRRLRLLGHGLAEPAGHGVETIRDRLVQLVLARAEHLRDGGHAALHL